ncbi:ankyrin repeat-containing domain protein [Fusarium venenatum]|uniref:ankyrin repeat-containing domain protein n=1 Tax=Fusarium venenatum TaxID=56646 RepID=UPI001D8C8379|nr:ankyrin repeat-containing domain protein [Fusarium venenatum]
MNRVAKRRTNIRSGDWKIIGRYLSKRKDRQSTVYLNGNALSTEKVERAIYRNFPTTLERLQEEPCPPLPEGVTISTPPQSPTQPHDGLYSLPSGLPSFLFRIPYDSLALSKAAKNLDSMTSSSALDFVRSILPSQEREDFMSQEYIQAVCNELRNTVPERFEGELELIVNRLLEPSPEQIVRFAAERFINDRLTPEEMQRLFRLVQTSGYDDCLLSCLKVEAKATKCLATAILGAAMLNNNEHFVRVALDHGADPNCSIPIRYQTPLSLATRDPAKSKLIPMLLDAGAKPDDRDIYRVAKRRDIDLVERLVPRATFPDIGRLVILAARRGDVELFRSLIILGATHNEWSRGPKEAHPLHLALLGHHFELAQLLIDLEPPDDNRIAYLKLVVERGDRLAAEFLIQHGTDVNARMPYGTETALSLSIRQGNQDIIQLLLRHGADPCVGGPGFLPQRRVIGTNSDSIQTALEDAVRSGSIEKTQLLLSMGAKAKESDTTSFLLGLAVKKSPHLIPVLLRAGADISNMFEWTSLTSETSRATMLEVAVESATASGSLDVVEIVLRLGAPVNRVIPDPDMPSALQIAVTQNMNHRPLSEVLTVDLVRLLLEWGADIDVLEFLSLFWDENEDSEAVKMTLVQSAAAQGRTALVRLLVSAGADCNSPAGKHGFTAIQAAARFGDAEMVEYLIQSGADVNTPPGPNYGLPALVAAVARNDLKSVSSLLQAGADPNTPGIVSVDSVRQKMTALQTASCQPGGYCSSKDSPKLRLKMLKLLLNAGASPQTPRFTDARKDRSSLAWAVYWDDIDAIKLLLDFGAHADVAEALQTAQDYESPLEILYLLGATCCEDARRSRDTLSCRCGNFQSQLEPGRDPCVFPVPLAENEVSMHQLLEVGQDGFPCCLHSATLQGNFAKVNHLLEHGADVNLKGGNTCMRPLQIAAEKGYVTIAHRLIQAGADTATAVSEAKCHRGLDICYLLQVDNSGQS